MVSVNEKVSGAIETIRETAELDGVIEVTETPDFVEVIGRTGMDIVVYRVCGNGMVYIRV